MHKTHLLLLICLAFFLIAATLIPTAPAIEWWNIGGGGGSISQDITQLDAVIGQGVLGFESQAGKEICSGYLCEPAIASVFLPMVVRNY
jgi:hypothetical protein